MDLFLLPSISMVVNQLINSLRVASDIGLPIYRQNYDYACQLAVEAACLCQVATGHPRGSLPRGKAAPLGHFRYSFTQCCRRELSTAPSRPIARYHCSQLGRVNRGGEELERRYEI